MDNINCNHPHRGLPRQGSGLTDSSQHGGVELGTIAAPLTENDFHKTRQELLNENVFGENRAIKGKPWGEEETCQSSAEDEFVVLEKNVISMSRFLLDQLDESFVQSIPISQLRDLPRFYMYLFSVILYLMMLLGGALFFWQTYTTSMTKAYVGLSDNDGDCKPVETFVSGTFTTGLRGSWQINGATLTPIPSMYQMSTLDAQFTNQEYTNVMTDIRENTVNVIGKMSSNQTLNRNIIYWMNYIEKKRYESNEFNFQFSGDPAVVFDKLYTSAYLVSATCMNSTISPSILYQSQSAQFVLTFDYESFNSNGGSRVTSPRLLGFADQPNKHDLAVVRIDMYSFTTALALNWNVFCGLGEDASNCNPYDRLEKLPAYSSDFMYLQAFTYNGATYRLRQVTDGRYFEMHPAVCVVWQSGDDKISKHPINEKRSSYCFLPIMFPKAPYGVPVLGIPVFNSVGHRIEFNTTLGANNTLFYESLKGNMPCKCPDSLTSPCQNFDFLISYIYFEQSMQLYRLSDISSGNNLAELMEPYLNLVTNYDPFELNELVYAPIVSKVLVDAAIAANPPQFHSTIRANVPTDPKQWAFCGGNCKILTLAAGDTLNRRVSKDFYILMHGSCSDSFSGSPDMWSRILQEPPVTLTENYLKCTMKQKEAVVNAIGIAAGNTTTFVPLAFFLFLPFIYMFLRVMDHIPPPEEFDVAEKTNAIDWLAVQLLRARDIHFATRAGYKAWIANKRRRGEGVEEDSTVSKLAKDLIVSANMTGKQQPVDSNRQSFWKPMHESANATRLSEGGVFRRSSARESIMRISEFQDGRVLPGSRPASFNRNQITPAPSPMPQTRSSVESEIAIGVNPMMGGEQVNNNNTKNVPHQQEHNRPRHHDPSYEVNSRFDHVDLSQP